MDNETVKILILEKLFNVLMPKISSYRNILYTDSVVCWSPNLYYIEEIHRGTEEEYIENIQINFNENNCVETITYTKTFNNQHYDYARAMRLAGMGRGIDVEYPIPQPITIIFNSVKIAIKEITKLTNIKFLTKITICALKEIEIMDDPNNFSIGAIKEILNIHPDLNLSDIETRKVLLEKNK